MIFTTIHISSNNIKLTAVKRGAVIKWDVLPLETGLVRDGRIVDPPRVGELIDSLLRSASVPRNNVTITVSGLPYTYRVMDFPKMKLNQIEDAITSNVINEFTIPLENLYVSWSPVNYKKDTTEYFVVGVDRQFIDSIVETAKFARVTNWSLDMQPLALARAAAQKNAIIASLDYDYVNMVLVQDGQVKDMHSANVDMVVDNTNRSAYFNMFSSELAKLISYHSNTKGYQPVDPGTPVLLAGEALADFMKATGSEELLELMHNVTGYPVQFLSSWMTYPEYFVEANYATNIGLAMRKMRRRGGARSEFQDIKLDLLMGKYDKKPQTLNVAYIILPAAVVVAVVIFMAVTNGQKQNDTDIAKLQSDLAAANQNLTLAREAAAEQDKTLARIDQVTADIQASTDEYNQLLGGRGRVSPDLTKITNTLPAGADFTLVTMENNKIQINGSVNDPFDAIDYLRALENVGYTDVNIAYIGPNSDNSTEYPFTIMIMETGSTGG